VSYWAQWCPVDTVCSHGVLCGVAVQPFRENMVHGTREASMWLGWAQRCIAAWNLCLDAAALCSCIPGTPSYVLADIIQERGVGAELEAELRRQFLAGVEGGQGNAAYPICVPEMPAIPDDRGHIIV
jgi:hypothetical protein